MFCCKCSPVIGCGEKQGSALDIVLGEGSDRQDGAPSTPAGPSLDHHSQQRREKKKKKCMKRCSNTSCGFVTKGVITSISHCYELN